MAQIWFAPQKASRRYILKFVYSIGHNLTRPCVRMWIVCRNVGETVQLPLVVEKIYLKCDVRTSYERDKFYYCYFFNWDETRLFRFPFPYHICICDSEVAANECNLQREEDMSYRGIWRPNN